MLVTEGEPLQRPEHAVQYGNNLRVCVCVSVSAVGSLSQSLAKPIDPPPARTTEGPANSGISNFKEARLCVVSTHTESHTSVSTKMQPSCRTSVWAEVVFYSG